jgi:beta-glucanase (GH16 family)
VSLVAIEDLMGKCGHTYQANFKYGTKDKVDLADVNNSYLEIYLEGKGGTSVDINGTEYTLNSDGMMWLMLDPGIKITSGALGIEDDKNRTTVAGKIHTIFRTTSEKKFTGAELYMLEEVQYGKFEARMKMAAASGTVSSMFLYQDGSEIADGRPWVEIDLEVLGKDPGSFQSNIITGKAGAQKTSEKTHEVAPAADQAFHTYAIEWTPNYVRWTVDGVEVRKTEGGQVTNLTGTQGLRFNLWSSESAQWVGEFDESALPLFQFINWVKVYKYTPGTGEDGSDFTLDWQDDFNTFDNSRWGKGEWTFDGNRVNLTARNAYTKDGMMILALTLNGREHFGGAVPTDPDDQQ